MLDMQNLGRKTFFVHSRNECAVGPPLHRELPGTKFKPVTSTRFPGMIWTDGQINKQQTHVD